MAIIYQFVDSLTRATTWDRRHISSLIALYWTQEFSTLSKDGFRRRGKVVAKNSS